MMRLPLPGAGGLARFSTALIGLVSVLFPFLVLAVPDRIGTWPVIALLAVAVVLRICLRRPGHGIGIMIAAQAGAVAVIVGVGWFDEGLGTRLYPVAINAALLIVFAASLSGTQTVIERMARLSEPDLPAKAIGYCRQVTRVWCIFFLVNGMIALATVCLADPMTWAIYNGLVAYVAAGCLFAGEYAVRMKLRRQAGGE